MIIEDETRLKTWISQVVEDISDAEPDALAKYVIALIKKPLSDADLEKLCTDKLSVFLQSHTESFVSRLFETLKSGQYLPKTDALTSSEPPKLILQQTKSKIDQKSAAEHDELVLTDGESDHDQEREEILQPKRTRTPKEMPQQQQLHAKAVSVLSSPRSASAKEQQHSSSPRRSAAVAEHRPKVRAASPPSTVATIAAQSSVATGKPPRKRISPPPRSTSMERRAANRRASPLAPLRRRVVLTGGNGGGSMRISSSTRLMVDRERERHHRGGTSAGGSGRGTIVGRSRSKSRSPHRKEKRNMVGAELEPRISSRRHRCRDFHEKGFCMRGDNCPFDHGPDPVVVENSALKDIVCDTTIFDTSTTYGVNPPPPGLESTVTPSAICVNKISGGVTEGYNPEAPSMDNSAAVPQIDFSVPPPPLPQHFLQQQRQILYPPAPTASGIIPTFGAATVTTAPTNASGGGVLPLRSAVDSSLGGGTLRAPLPSTIAVSVSGSQLSYGGAMSVSAITTLSPLNGTSTVTSSFLQDNGGRMAMRGGRFKPYIMASRNPNTRSLLVRKIPPELNKIAQIDQHFSRFGQVTNIQVQYEGRTDSALVTFKTRREAMSAYKSTEPLFNNRFVKVFWQNDANGKEIENEDIGGGNGEIASTGPTIPLVDSNATNRKTVLKEPIQFPRYFTKVFAQQKKEGGDGSGSAEESTTVTAEPSDDKKSLPTDLATTEHHPPVPVPGITALQHPVRPIYNSKLATQKKRSAIERDRLNKLAEVQRMKTELYTKLVEQQKSLLKKLQQTEDKEAKKKIVKYLKTFELKVDGVKTELEQLALKMREMQMRQPPTKRTRIGHSISEQQLLDNGAELGSQLEPNKIHQQSPSKYSISNKKLLKLCRVVYVSACPQEFSEKLILHMERFGELFDYDINATPQIFTYKEPLDAQRAVNEAVGSFELAKLKVEWAPVAKGVKGDKDIVPDGERKPSEQVAAKDLIALLEYDEEEEDEKKEGDEEQLSDKEGNE
ncbi:hypothetical protein niasHS_003900 [Heterodera schachtii]|uniref:C3H1-type domain-containing protein n=1 Tax=Heterodera schachtii TaxID=97005 RepID=A0ABD2K3M0_HETSC